MGGSNSRRKKQEENDPYRQFSSPTTNQTQSPEPVQQAPQPAQTPSKDPFLQFSDKNTVKPEAGAWPKDAVMEEPSANIASQKPMSPPQVSQNPPPTPPTPPAFPPIPTPPATNPAAPPQDNPKFTAPSPPNPFNNTLDQSQAVNSTSNQPQRLNPPSNHTNQGPNASFAEPVSPFAKQPLNPSSGLKNEQISNAPVPPLPNKQSTPNSPGFVQNNETSTNRFSKKAENKNKENSDIPKPVFKRVQSRKSLTDLPAQVPTGDPSWNQNQKSSEQTFKAGSGPPPMPQPKVSEKSSASNPPPMPQNSPQSAASNPPPMPQNSPKSSASNPPPMPQSSPQSAASNPPPMPQNSVQSSASNPPPMPQNSPQSSAPSPPPMPQNSPQSSASNPPPMPAQFSVQPESSAPSLNPSPITGKDSAPQLEPMTSSQPEDSKAGSSEGPSLNFEWSSTGTSADVNLDKQDSPPKAPVDKDLNPTAPEPIPSKSLVDTNKKPQESFPMYSSTDWEKPDAAMQLTAPSDRENQIAETSSKHEKSNQSPHSTPTKDEDVIKLTVHSPETQSNQIDNQKPSVPPNQPTNTHQPDSKPAIENSPSHLPKMKKFAQKTQKPSMQQSAIERKSSDNQFTKIDGSQHPNSSQPTNPSKPVDPRLIAKQAAPAEVQTNSIAQNQEPGQVDGKLYNVEGHEISEPRELNKPSPDTYAKNQTDPNNEQTSSPSQARLTPEQAPVQAKPNIDFSLNEPEHVEVEKRPANPPEPQNMDITGDATNQEARLQQANAHIRTAESALSNDNFSVAMPLLNKALMLITESGAINSAAALSCHQKLGECSYQKSDYEEACEHYEKCKTIVQSLGDVDPETIILIQQKLAKSLEKAQRFSEAKTASLESIDLATDLLEPAHPLVNVAYRMHITLLQKTNAPNQEIERCEEELKAVESGSTKPIHVSDEVSNHVNYLTGSFKMDNITKQKQLRDSRKRISSSRFPSETKRFNFVPIVIAVVVICFTGLGIGGFFLLNNSSSDSKNSESNSEKTADTKTPNTKTPTTTSSVSKNMEAYIGNTYKSADGLRSITINADGTVEFKAGTKSRLLNWKEGDPNSNMISDFTNMISSKTTYSLHKTAQGFSDNNGAIYYDDSAPDLVIVKEMKHIAELAKYYFSKKGKKYPKVRANFEKLGADISLKNPLGKGMKPIVRLRYFDEDLGQIERDKNIKEMRSGKPLFPPDSQNKLYPGLIECMSLRPFDKAEGIDGISFIIRAYGHNGEFIRSSESNSVFVLAQENGVPMTTLDPKELNLPFEKKKNTIVHFIFKNE